MFTFEMVGTLKHVYENIGEVGTLSPPIILAQVTELEKKLVTEYLQNELSYILYRNHIENQSHYRKTYFFTIEHITNRSFDSQ